MPVYMYTTNINAQRVNYLYRCSKCRNLIAQNTYVEGMANYNGRAALTKSSRQAAEQRAENAQSASSMASLLNLRKALDRAKQADYRLLKMSGRCPVCGNREPWQHCSNTSKASLRISISYVLTPFALFLGFATLNAEVYSMAAVFLGLAAFLLINNIRILLRNKKMHSLCATVPEESRPHFFFNDEEFTQACAQLGMRTDEEIREDYHDWENARN